MTPSEIIGLRNHVFDKNRLFAEDKSLNKGNKSQLKKEKQALDLLINILHYLRFLFKTYKLTTKSSFDIFERDTMMQLQWALMEGLVTGLQMQEKMIQNKDNVYDIKGWYGFVNSKKWEPLKAVV